MRFAGFLTSATARKLVRGGLVFLTLVAGTVSLTTVSLRAAEPTKSDKSLLAERLATGEFGPAIDAASAVADATEKAKQLQQIAGAQRQAKEFRGAAETARRIPEARQRSREGAEVARDNARNGGGSMADFNSLMNLVRDTVQPDTWDDNGGPGSMTPYQTGVRVDPNGLVRRLSREEQTGTLETLSRRSRSADLNDDLARATSLRLVSLKRIERAVSECVSTGRPVPETLRHLAGLTGVQFVFAHPEENDIVIAGPAEPWRYDDLGRAVGRDSGKPLLELDDLVVVLRSFAPGGDGVFGCSINTRDANLKAVKEFVETSNQRPLGPGQLGGWLKELQSRLGLQDVVVNGVPANTHVAQVLVEADYKMKLIGVDKLDGGPGIPSYFTLLRKSNQMRGAPMEALRWWLTMKCDAIAHSPDRLSFEFQGSSVLVQSENQFVNAQGQHVPTGVAEPINRQFAENFTREYSKLSEREPVFADLRNIFDMALVAAVCQQEHLYERSGWNQGVFAANGAYRPAEVYAPSTIESVINHKVYGGKDIVVQVAGGVQVDHREMARDKALEQESAKLNGLVRHDKLPEGRWWWDSK